MGAPIRRALRGLHKGIYYFIKPRFLIGATDPSFNCELGYRSDEKYWVMAGKAEVTVAFALNFDNTTDRALARIFLLVLLIQN